MSRNIDLVNGSISKGLLKLALPIMGTSFLQTAYNITDMFWIGQVGTKEVAAVGTAGFFTWFAMAFIIISKIGAEVKVSQNLGRKDISSVKHYISTSIQINLILSTTYALFIFIFRKQLIGFFKLGDTGVINMAESYLMIICAGLIFYFINPVFTAIFNGAGDSSTPLKINTLGLIFNIIFDPIMIFGIGPFKAMGVEGAALATVLAQILVSVCFIYRIVRGKEEYFKFNIFEKLNKDYANSIIRLGIPVAFQEGLFTIFAMLIARIIAKWGAEPIGVQKIGSQIEAISWMTAGGLSTALSAFVGQNYGAGKKDRIIKGYIYTMAMAVGVGIFATLVLMLLGGDIFKMFVPHDPESIKIGADYLRILSYSQLFMCIEITTKGAFNGLGRTMFPSLISIIFTGLRVPAADILSNNTPLGLNGIWWSISMSSVFKGVILTAIFLIIIKKGKILNWETKTKQGNI
ncbi:MATE family efflux transporter [Clostridium polynesiense]|uniref:MATE family efflux transporter n=1 Tax=Clostridium polynesiense TaxID=1325933 RepID=UPI00058F40FF|nr:MATE family efflux transporter [Clostridium polynesiense]